MTFGTNIRRMAGRATALAATLGICAAVLPLLADGTPQNLPVSQNWNNAALITVNDTWSGVPGFEGFRGDGITSATGVDPQTLLVDGAPDVVNVIANQLNPNTLTTGGVAEFGITDPVVALNGSGTADAPYLRLSISTTGITGVRVRYTLRDLDGSADNAVQPIALHYRVGTTGLWTNVPAAFVADATTGPSLATLTTPVDVTLPAAVDNQPIVQLRVMTANAVGNDEWVGIDDIVVEAATAPTAPTITGATGTPGTVEHGQTLVIAATAAAGSNPASTTLSVTADATAVGGATALPLLDDGVAPDATAGDRIFTGQTIVAASAGSGPRTIPLTVTDEFARTGGGTLTVTVIAPIPTVTIPEIQGSGVASSLTGQVVRTRGVVTARKFNGLYLQSEPGTEDGNPATSDGIFVFTSSAPNAAYQPGDVLSVVGTVVEFVPSVDPQSPPLTELSFATFVEVGTAALPAPVAITPALADPNGGLQQLEPLEGMRVSIASLTAVSGSDGNVNEPNNTGSNTGVFYTVLTGTPRPVREAGIPAMDPVLVCAAGTGCTIPVFDQNPELLRVDADAIQGVTAPVVTTGALMTDVTAIVDYGFRSYTLLPTAPLVPAGLSVGVPARPRAAGEFTVASYNLQRLFDTVNDPNVGDPVVTATAYANRLIKISAAVRGFLHTPDILGVQEAENLTVLQDLAARIDADATAAGQPAPGYTAFLLEGNDVGGIDVGFLVTSRVTVQSVVQHGLTDTYTNPVNGLQETLNDRPSLSIRATVAAEPGTLPAEVVAVVHHLRSLNGVDEADGRVRAKRLAQAEYVARTLDGLRASYPGVPVVSVGDYNAFEVNDGYVDVLGVARGVPAPASDVVLFGADLLASDFLLAPAVAATPAGQTYSYVFEGSAQSLDHVLVSAEAAAALAAFDHARINADFPEIYRGDATRVERTSDHDPAIAYFRFPRDLMPPVVTVPADQQVTAQGPFGALVTYTASATDDIDGSVAVTCAPASGSLFAVGATLVSCTATDAVGNVGSATFTVTVVNPNTAGLLAGATVQGLGPAGTRVVFSAARTTGGQSGASVLAIGRLGSGAPALFVATGIGAVSFYNDPASSPGPWPASGVDTTRVVGTGWLNGVAGHTFELVAVDRGEPGRGRDGVQLTVRTAQGVVVLQTTGVIDAGNVDSLPIW
jgi:predicted extracellular nuclease